jgi:uncharacterized protein (DUF1499 family)
MGLLRWFTKNWANTLEPTHPDLTPLALPLGAEAAANLVKQVVAQLPRWAIATEKPGELQLTRQTRIIGFVDDVTVTIVLTASGVLLHAASKSRVGIGDLGQNRRNILELWAAIRARQGES